MGDENATKATEQVSDGAEPTIGLGATTRRRILRTGIATAMAVTAASYVKPSFESLGTPTALAWASSRPPQMSPSPNVGTGTGTGIGIGIGTGDGDGDGDN
ncbi:MAG: hypothetical protein NVSMB2_21580 [Chloroflexota bacterium]